MRGQHQGASDHSEDRTRPPERQASTRITTTARYRCWPSPTNSSWPSCRNAYSAICAAAAIAQAALPPRPDQPPRAVPERIGEPSLIKHVVYVIKENRTYDQVFGALGRGRGRADLCVFGEAITPNQHKLVNEFVLLDNTYCAGILSADGHQWSTTAFSTDYMERSFAGFPRSYPDGMGTDEADALAYSPAGFLWDNAVLHGKSMRNYGEFMAPAVRWRDAAKAARPISWPAIAPGRTERTK